MPTTTLLPLSRKPVTTLLVWRRSMSAVLCVALCASSAWAQLPQLSPGDVDRLRNLPQPYEMRDWKAVARGADALMFDAGAEGEYLPLVRYRTPYNGRRLTDSIFGVPSFVGDTRGEGLEGILTLPSVVSGLLVGIDKRNQGPDSVDYVRMTQDWFSRRDDENVYLNLPLTSTGEDWWYETMPNVFFQQIYALAGDYGAAEAHFTRVAEQWTAVVSALGGSATPWRAGDFDYRSFRIRDLEPVEGGVPEPEAAGAIAYILANAYAVTGERRYRYAAEQALEFLDGLDRNPRYELQLYYGVLAAARLNATERTNYNLEKLLGWSLSRGPLRGWGISRVIADGTDLGGLVGEVGSGNDYLFFMNGMQAVGALAPVARYDARLARAIGKYVLNVANQSRLFYWRYLPPDQQDSYDWASTYDPNAHLAYEALRERLNGEEPFATGDAQRLGWAPTNIGLYGTAHTGYLAAVVDTTDVEAVLSLDLNATDFYAPASYPTRLVYNPHDGARTVTVRRPEGAPESADVYDVVTGGFVAEGLIGDLTLEVPADAARVLVWAPSGAERTFELGQTLLDGVVVDYNRGTFAPEGQLRMKAVAAEADSVARGDTIRVHAVLDYAFANVAFRAELDGLPFTLVDTALLGGGRGVLTLKAGADTGTYRVPITGFLPRSANTGPAGDTITLRVVPAVSSVREAPAAIADAVARPNPTTGATWVVLPQGAYEVTVVNALGQAVSRVRTGATADGLRLDLAALPAGTYVAHFRAPDDTSYRARLVRLTD